jgi:hypothetical protein
MGSTLPEEIPMQELYIPFKQFKGSTIVKTTFRHN